jgi:ribonuclease P protein component
MGRTWASLKQRADFLRAAGSGLKRVTPAFILQAARPADGANGRVGFTVSRKVGNAVIRNRARRRLRAVADLVIGTEMAGTLSYDLVMIGRGEALTRGFSAMAADLRHAIARVGREPSGQKPSGPKRRAS